MREQRDVVIGHLLDAALQPDKAADETYTQRHQRRGNEHALRAEVKIDRGGMNSATSTPRAMSNRLLIVRMAWSFSFISEIRSATARCGSAIGKRNLQRIRICSLAAGVVLWSIMRGVEAPTSLGLQVNGGGNG